MGEEVAVLFNCRSFFFYRVHHCASFCSLGSYKIMKACVQPAMQCLFKLLH
jgi:hypothetical protein